METGGKMETLITRIRIFLNSLKHKKRQIFISNFNKNLDYWEQEDDINYSILPTFRTGDFIHVDFCSNIGNEQGGSRYAVVIENSPRASGCVVVLPIHGSIDYLPPKYFHSYIGKPFIFLSKEHHYVILSQIRSISKLRINKKYGILPKQIIQSIKSDRKEYYKL